jgi:hypothetical protein
MVDGAKVKFVHQHINSSAMRSGMELERKRPRRLVWPMAWKGALQSPTSVGTSRMALWQRSMLAAFPAGRLHETSRLGYGSPQYLQGVRHPYLVPLKDELEAMEESKKAIEEELRALEARIEEIKKNPKKT